jgi:RimJ/RimL family protein N-acetyltransferase
VPVRLEPWATGDLPLLERLLGDPELTKHVGGPESRERLLSRQARFERLSESGEGRMFKIVDDATGEALGSVGYWDRAEEDGDVYEAGWFVLPEAQGRGVAAEATAQVIAHAKADGKHRYLHAFPSVDNTASNALCRKLGFTWLGEAELEYPPGNVLLCNDWQLDLRA